LDRYLFALLTNEGSSMKHTTLALLALGTSACLGFDGEDIASVEQGIGGSCPPFACGSESNSPVIDMYGFHDLKNPAVGAEENTGGFTLLSFEATSGFKTKNVRVKGAELLIGGGKGTPPVVDGYLRLKHRSGTQYLIYIKASDKATYWAKNGDGNKTHTYFIKWLVAPAGGGLPKQENPEWPNVCSNAKADQQGGMGMNGQHVVFFEGDRIDANRIEVTGLDEDWFNIGCAGHALAKLHLSGHTHGAMVDSTDTMIDTYAGTKGPHRTTYLKMISGDYCGTGRPFTIAGMPLNWADIKTYDTGVAGHWLKFENDNGASPNNLEIEARWSEKGATCLNAPRVDHNLSAHPEGKMTYDPMGFADLEEAIKAECSRPAKCVPDDEYEHDKHHLVSANIL
jgi:hypothetical protein